MLVLSVKACSLCVSTLDASAQDSTIEHFCSFVKAATELKTFTFKICEDIEILLHHA